MANGPGRYVLDVDGRTPVEEPDLLAWGRWMETADRHVRETMQGDNRVSTVFLGLDHQFGEGRPILFETMVFGGPHDGEQDRYSTWVEAAVGHERWVKLVFGVARRDA